MITDQELQTIFYKAGLVAESLEAAASVLRAMEESIPPPPEEELQEIAKGNRPFTTEAFLYVILEATIPGVEYTADNLRRMTPELLSKLREFGLGSVGLDAIIKRLEELRSER